MAEMNRRRFLALSMITPAAAMAATANHRFVSLPGQAASGGGHTFGFAPDGSAFLLDGQPFQIRSGEMHPARIPVEYWRQRIQMAKAMGMNTIAVYLFWNFFEQSPGVFDFTTGRHNVAAFLEICQEEGMWVLVRGGPYCDAEWDCGGVPPYLLGYPGIQLRVSSAVDPRYMAAATQYYQQLVPLIKPLMIANGGPVLMVQIENEYGSYGSDPAYLEEIRQAWIDGGVEGPFYTEDGLSELLQNHTNIPGGAIALSGAGPGDIATCRQDFPDVPCMSGEVYPGNFTWWGEGSFTGENDISSLLAGFMDGGMSFNIYVIHGGTSFGYFAGSHGIQCITSYDYAAPISEQGVARDNYTEYRQLLAGYLSEPLPPVPAAPPTITLSGDPRLVAQPVASVWDNLPPALPAAQTVNPQSMETYGQGQGFLLYRTVLDGFTGGQLNVNGMSDYATVFVNGSYQGGLSRPGLPPDAAARQLVSADSPLALQTPASSENATLDIFIEAMGHNSGPGSVFDPKGITQDVTLAQAGPLSGTVIGWQVFLLPMDEAFLQTLQHNISAPARPGLFFRAMPQLSQVADTYVDMSGWAKGIVWVNRHNLGRYWEIGPQYRLFCPASWLKQGTNEVIIFDHHLTQAQPIAFASTLA